MVWPISWEEVAIGEMLGRTDGKVNRNAERNGLLQLRDGWTTRTLRGLRMGCLMRRTTRRWRCMHAVLHRRQVAVREFSRDLELFLCGQAHHGPIGIFWVHRRGIVQFLVGGVARGFYVGLEIGALFGRQSLAGVEPLLHLARHDAQAQPLGRVGATADLLGPRLLLSLLRRSPLFVHLLHCLGMRAGK